MTPPLPSGFLDIPLAHRGLHDIALNRPENSRAGIGAAIARGYGIEIDVQLSADGQALVFHDYDLARLTGETGPVRGRTVAQAQQIQLQHGEGETIPTLSQVLELVNGRVPVLIEIKDQDGAMGPDIGPLETATVRAIEGYGGPVAMMSFNPHSTAALARLAPHVPCGLVTCGYDPQDWPLSAQDCQRLREIPDFDTISASFISHDKNDLDRARVRELRDGGVPVLCWTIRSRKEEAVARIHADNVTFEGYPADIPG
ncbi:phosphodiesterase [Rhodobacteraceae bacterium F11138]|nr:phosphodiesterase [Rhodobacteraceae bacterium F11138]